MSSKLNNPPLRQAKIHADYSSELADRSLHPAAQAHGIAALALAVGVLVEDAMTPLRVVRTEPSRPAVPPKSRRRAEHSR